ncbi:hypothetical protein I8748_05490 [Nostoc sp. CENA67]|uniref:DeoxyPurine in DNA protein A domain-containing protein n=1 Tax=Amazonocrinis nigriterrae CENA67 TaxID=2794033 RepID=A0A8J7L9M4_9NOST|nr:hypothetical protein [Amazonocrinis nigriterrae]MBH8561636.1 hypothetical protein [Amazonocrinis nigriterrae CENA67]
MSKTSPGDDFVQNQAAIADRFRTESPPGVPLFFIGSSPSQASTILSPDYPAAGVMVSVNTLRDRKSDFVVGDWILDSGAFTEVARYGGYRHGVEQYYWQIKRWSGCGNLLIAIAQDWMCESFVLQRTGLTVAEHQRLTVERYDQLVKLKPTVRIMPVLQGYRVSDYIKHLDDYGTRLAPGAWVGVGSVCRRNGNPEEVADILRTIKLIRPDLQLHGFGLKILALENAEVRSLLYSTDSMAWSYPRRFQPNPEPEIPMAHNYQQRIYAAVTDSVQKRVPPTAGAGNGQGRKPKWETKTGSVRLPEKYIPRVVQLCRQWEAEEDLLE